MPNDIGIVILAAGASTRLGSPKQLLSYNGATLIERILDAALKSDCDLVIAVLGAHASLIRQRLPKRVHPVYNPHWPNGIHTSIRFGIESLLTRCSGLKAAVLSMCDQPYLESSIFNELIRTYDRVSQRIVASAYSGTLGTPALFDSAWFPDLLQLSAGGAKTLIERHSTHVISIPFAKGGIDIDTPADYTRLQAIR
jgi:molybdenum cofactor cytidylyltransferase